MMMGINSPALEIMSKRLKHIGEIYIIVPERERSGGKSCYYTS